MKQILIGSVITIGSLILCCIFKDYLWILPYVVAGMGGIGILLVALYTIGDIISPTNNKNNKKTIKQ